MAVNKNNSDIIWAKYVVTKPFLDRLQKDSSLNRLGAKVNGEIDLEKVRKILVDSDPNPPTNKKYFEWILLGYIDGGNHLLEDVRAHMKNTLNKFKVLVQKKTLPTKLCDLSNYCGLFGCTRKGREKLGLLNTLNDYPDVESGTATRKMVKKDADLVLHDDLISVYHPKTVEASQLYGSNTKWCTAAKGENMFDEYNEQGPLYIIIPNQPTRKAEKYQLHLQTFSFMDEQDSPITDEDYTPYKKSLESFIKTINYQVTPTQLYNQMFEGLDDVEAQFDYELYPILDLLSKNIDFSDNQDPYAILFAVITDNLNLVKKLINQGVDLHVTDILGSNIIFYAHSSEVIKLLVKSGVEINHHNNNGDTPLMIAIRYQSDKLKSLLDLGADTNTINDNGTTPLRDVIDHAMFYDDIHLLLNDVKLLLDAKADPDLHTQDTDGPLVSAIIFELTDVVKLLLKYNANPNLKGIDGNTPLHHAIINPEITQLLLDSGANPNTKNDYGFTPLDLAINKIDNSDSPEKEKFINTVKILQSH